MARKIQVEIVGDASSFQRALRQAGVATSGFGSTLGRLGKVLAGGALAGLALSTKAAVNFESAFAGVKKTVDGTPEQLAKLEDGFRAMSREIPQSAVALAEIGETAGQLGIARKDILKFTRVIADLGETTNLAGEEGATMLARFGNVTNLNPRDYDRLGAAIVALGNAGASTEAEIGEMAMRIGAAGTLVGLTQPEILGLSNAMSSLGMEAEAGGSAVSRTFAEMATAVASGGKDLSKFADTAGMTAGQFKTLFKDDAAGALVAFTDGLARVKSEGGNVFEVLDDLGLGGLRVRDALLRMAGAGDLVTDSIKLGNEAWKENTALTDEAAKRYETAASKFSVLKNNIVDIGISIGNAILPTLVKAAEKLSGFFRKISEAKGFRAKISVVWTGFKEAVGELWDLLSNAFSKEAMFGSARHLRAGIDVSEWKIENTEGWVNQLVSAIKSGIASVNWTAVGQAIGDAIRKGVPPALEAGKEIGREAARGVREAWDGIGEGLGVPKWMRTPVDINTPGGQLQGWLPDLGGIEKALGALQGLDRKAGGLFDNLKPGGTVDQKVGGFFKSLVGKIEGEAQAAGNATTTGMTKGLGTFAASVSRFVVSGVDSVRRHQGDYAAMGLRLGEGTTVGATTGFRPLPAAAANATAQAAAKAASNIPLFTAAGTKSGQGVTTGAQAGLRGLPAAVSTRVAAGAAAASAQIGAFGGAGSSLGGALSGGVVAGLSGIGARVASTVISQVNSALATVRAAFGIHSPSDKTRDDIGKPLGEGIVTGFILGTGPLPEKMKESIRTAIEAARGAIERGREELGTAMDALSARILRVFDAQTSAWKSNSEKALEALAQQEEVLQAARRIQELTDSVTAARTAQTEFTPTEGMSPEDESRRREELGRAVLEAEARLAEEQRLQALAAERKRLEELAAQERLDYEARRAERRLKLEERLSTLAKHFEKEGATVGTALDKIKKLMRAFDVSFAAAGATVGQAFVAGLKGAIAAAADNAGDLSGLIRRIANGINIPALAEGGIVTRPTLALVGEAGPEAVIPLRRGMSTAAGAGGAVHIHFHGGTFVGGDAERLVRDIETPLIRALQESKRRGGPGLTD